MKVIALKKFKIFSGKEVKVGVNLEVSNDYGQELVESGKAGEIPQMVSGDWYVGGEPSNEMIDLRQAKGSVTIEKYKKYQKTKIEE